MTSYKVDASTSQNLIDQVAKQHRVQLLSHLYSGSHKLMLNLIGMVTVLQRQLKVVLGKFQAACVSKITGINQTICL